MNIVCLHLLALHMGVLVASFGHADYIGCYKKTDAWSTSETFTNSSHACKRYCVPDYRYAGVSLSECFCGSHIHAKNKVDDTACNLTCLDQQFNDSCGSYHTMSVYNAAETSTTDSPSSSLTTLETTTSHGKTPTVNTTETSTSNVTSCVLICVAVAVCLVVINNIVLCVCKKIRRPKQETKSHGDGYGYISPVNVIELDDVTTEDKVLPEMNKGTTNSAGASANMYDYVDSNNTERQYTYIV